MTCRAAKAGNCQAAARASSNSRGVATLPRRGTGATGLVVPVVLAAQQLIMPPWQQGMLQTRAHVVAEATGVDQACPSTSRTLQRMTVTNFTSSP